MGIHPKIWDFVGNFANQGQGRDLIPTYREFPTYFEYIKMKVCFWWWVEENEKSKFIPNSGNPKILGFKYSSFSHCIFHLICGSLTDVQYLSLSICLHHSFVWHVVGSSSSKLSTCLRILNILLFQSLICLHIATILCRLYK